MINKLEYDKIYFFLSKEDDVNTVTGFIKPIHHCGENQTAYWRTFCYEQLFIEHPIYKDESKLNKNYSKEIIKYRGWLKSEDLINCISDNKWLYERLYEIKDIEKFPLALPIGNSYVAIGPGVSSIKREWNIHLLLER